MRRKIMFPMTAGFVLFWALVARPCLGSQGSEAALKEALSAIASADRVGLQNTLNTLTLDYGNSAEANQALVLRAGAIATDLIIDLKFYKGCNAMQNEGVAFKGCFDDGYGFRPLELAMALGDILLGAPTIPELPSALGGPNPWEGMKVKTPSSREKEYNEVKDYVTELEQGRVPKATLTRIKEVTYSFWLNKIMGFVQEGFINGDKEQKALFFSVTGSLLIEAYALETYNDGMLWLAPSCKKRIVSAAENCLKRLKELSSAEPTNMKIRSLVETLELEISGM